MRISERLTLIISPGAEDHSTALAMQPGVDASSAPYVRNNQREERPTVPA